MLTDKRAAILVADGFEQVELTEPRKALDEAGARTQIVSTAKDQVQGWKRFDKADLTNAGAKLADEEAVVDQGLVSSRKLQDIPAFNRAMPAAFGKNGPPRRGNSLCPGKKRRLYERCACGGL
jgi:deglycase